MDNNVNNVNNNVQPEQQVPVTPTPQVPVTAPVQPVEVAQQVPVQPQVAPAPVATPVVTPAEQAAAQVIDPTLSSGAKRTSNPTQYTVANQGGNVKAVPIVPAPEEKLLKSKGSLVNTINSYYNKFIVTDAMCSHCKKYFFKATQPDTTKVRCPNCLEDHLISELKQAKEEYTDDLTEKLLFGGLALIVIGFFLYVDEIIRFIMFISIGLILCIPKLKREFKFSMKTALYAGAILLLIPVVVSILLS